MTQPETVLQELDLGDEEVRAIRQQADALGETVPEYVANAVAFRRTMENPDEVPRLLEV